MDGDAIGVAAIDIGNYFRLPQCRVDLLRGAIRLFHRRRGVDPQCAVDQAFAIPAFLLFVAEECVQFHGSSDFLRKLRLECAVLVFRPRDAAEPLGLLGEEKAPHAFEGIAALHGLFLWLGALLNPNGRGVRVEAIHHGLYQRGDSVFSGSP